MPDEPIDPRRADGHPIADHMPSDHPQLTNAELVQLRVRVIALENLVIALLSQAGEAQLRRVCDMAAYISPRPGFTHHPLTLQAASQMHSLLERADKYRTMVDDAAADPAPTHALMQADAPLPR